jgi:hypothetical protein
MKTITKWILGIVIGLVIVAFLATIGFVAFNRSHNVGWMMQSREFRPFGGDREMPMHPYAIMPHHMVMSFSPFRFLGGLLSFSLVAFLVVLGIVYLVRGLKKPQTVVTVPAQVSAPAPVEVRVHTCSNCGRTVQEDWSHCAYCGNTLS